MGRVTCWAVVAVLAGAGAVRAQPLEWEFDETCYLEVKHTARQTITMLGRTAKQETEIRFVFKVRPVKVSAAGTVLEHTVMTADDSGTNIKGEAEKDTFKGLRGQKFKVTLGPGNRTLTLGGVDDLLEPVFGDEAKTATDGERKFLTDTLTAVLLTHLIDAYVPLPAGGAGPADKWQNTAELALPPLAKVRSDREFTRLGRQVHEGAEVEVISWKSKVQVAALKGDDGVLPFKLSELKAVAPPENIGTILWDRAASRPLRIDSLQRYDLDMVLEIDGKSVKGKGRGSDTLVSRFLKTSPAKD